MTYQVHLYFYWKSKVVKSRGIIYVTNNSLYFHLIWMRSWATKCIAWFVTSYALKMPNVTSCITKVTKLLDCVDYETILFAQLSDYK